MNSISFSSPPCFIRGKEEKSPKYLCKRDYHFVSSCLLICSKKDRCYITVGFFYCVGHPGSMYVYAGVRNHGEQIHAVSLFHLGLAAQFLIAEEKGSYIPSPRCCAEAYPCMEKSEGTN